MRYAWLKMLVGQLPLPTVPLERCELLDFADSHHVLGQTAAAWRDRAEGKTRDIMENGAYRAQFDHKMLQFEMGRLERALEGAEVEPILLKGASYVAQGLRAGEGRRVSDIDILVHEDQLDVVEKRLRAAGWAFDEATDNEYDQAYYRNHMHELPPLRHNHRCTIVDVHHKLLPRTSRIEVNSDAFISAAKSLPGRRLKVFDEIDTFLHSAIHSFADGSFDTPARSLIELRYLFLDIAAEKEKTLLERAHIVGAEKPAAMAFWALAEFFDDLRAEKLFAKFKVGVNPITCWAISQKLRDISRARIAKFILYIRSHYLRMPLPMLVKHLATKGFRRVKKEPELPLPPGFQ